MVQAQRAALTEAEGRASHQADSPRARVAEGVEARLERDPHVSRFPKVMKPEHANKRQKLECSTLSLLLETSEVLEVWFSVVPGHGSRLPLLVNRN